MHLFICLFGFFGRMSELATRGSTSFNHNTLMGHLPKKYNEEMPNFTDEQISLKCNQVT